MHTVP
jgi:hypothetical protein